MNNLKPNTYTVRVVALRWQVGQTKTNSLGDLEVEIGTPANAILAKARKMWPLVPRYQFALVGFREKPEQQPVL